MATSFSDLQNATGAQRAPRTRPLVLVTDDHEDTRSLISTILELCGCAVIEASDGEEAVRLAESATPDLILMDAGLPRVDGIDATRRIRRMGQTGRVPIVFVSGHAEPSYRVVALEAGCDEYLVKPFRMKQLRGVLEKYLGGNAQEGIAT
jgi:CheY-like chemotaxis protein